MVADNCRLSASSIGKMARVAAVGASMDTRQTWKVTPSRRSPGGLVVIGPFDEAFKADLKAEIPAENRSWNSSLPAWLVREESREALLAVIERHSAQPC
jgi:hypothetical protein